MTAIRIQIALVALSAAMLAAHASSAVGAESLVYQCDDNKQLTAVVDDSDPDSPKTTISVAGSPELQKLEMQDVMSANGVKTSNGKLVWWTKGDQGFLAEEDPPAGNGEIIIGGCQEVPADQ